MWCDFIFGKVVVVTEVLLIVLYGLIIVLVRVFVAFFLYL